MMGDYMIICKMPNQINCFTLYNMDAIEHIPDCMFVTGKG